MLYAEHLKHGLHLKRSTVTVTGSCHCPGSLFPTRGGSDGTKRRESSGPGASVRESVGNKDLSGIIQDQPALKLFCLTDCVCTLFFFVVVMNAPEIPKSVR
jgi:hypothetical protein